MRNRVWDLMLKADINARYWKYYETRVTWIEKITRTFTILAATISLLAWALKDEYLAVATAISSLSAFIYVVVIPALGLDGYSAKVVNIKKSWVLIRHGYEDLWHDIDSLESPTWKKRFKTIKDKDAELEQGDLWTPPSKKLSEQAMSDCERLYVSTFTN